MYSLLLVPSREGTGYILQIYHSLILVPSREGTGYTLQICAAGVIDKGGSGRRGAGAAAAAQ